MKRRETILAVTTLVFGLGVIGAIFIVSPNMKEKQDKQATASGSMNNMSANDMAAMQDAQKNSDNLGDIIDLTNQTEVQMDIKDFKYEKPNIKIKKGTKVTWTNQDSIRHNVMLEHEGSDKPHDPPTVNEVDPNKLAGPLLAKGESYSFTFNEVTANPYHCSPHPYMKGSVTVVE